MISTSKLHFDWEEYTIESDKTVPTSVLVAILRESIPDRTEEEIHALVDTLDRRWINDKNQKLTKRIGKAIRKQFNISLSSDFFGSLHHLQEAYGPKKLQLRYKDLAKEGFWPVGKYGDSGSCYWGCHAAAKDILKDNGCFAVQYEFEGEKGRCWMVDHYEGLVIFNHYGPLTLLTIASAISSKNGLEHLKIDLENNGESSGTLYINGATGYLISKGPSAYPIDFGFEDDSYYGICHCCDERLSEDESAYGPDDNLYCEHCYGENTFYCEECNDTFMTDDGVEFEGRQFCNICIDDVSVECIACECRVSLDDTSIILGGELMCHECIPADTPHCEDCGETCCDSDGDRIFHEIDGDCYCHDCKTVETIDETERPKLEFHNFDYGTQPDDLHEYQRRWSRISEYTAPDNWSLGATNVVLYLNNSSQGSTLEIPALVSDNGLWAIHLDHTESRRKFKVIHRPSHLSVTRGSVSTISQAVSVVSILEYYCPTSDWECIGTDANLTSYAQLAGRKLKEVTFN